MAFSGRVSLAPQADDVCGEPSSSGRTLGQQAPRVLNRLHRQIAKDALGYLAADDGSRHRTRKRLKRLRYTAELVAPLFRGKAVARYLEHVLTAQEALGALNDLATADASFRAQLRTDARAWFAIGWITARKQARLDDCSKALAGLSRARRFWDR